MRRVLALAALTTALFAAGCGDDTDGSTATTPTSAPATTAAADNTKEVCAASEKIIADGATKLSGELTGIARAAASGDPTVKQQALDSVKSLFTTWSTGLRAEADRATNPELKQALTTYLTEVDKAATSLRSFDDLKNLDKFETAEMKSAGQTLDRLCG